MTRDCPFCAIVAGADAAIVTESHRAVAFLDRAPANDGHTLVVPRAHARDIWDLTPEDGAEVWGLAREVAQRIKFVFEPDGLTLAQANGEAAGQDVFHFHLHVIPRWRGDGFVRHWRPKRDATDLSSVAAQLRNVEPDALA